MKGWYDPADAKWHRGVEAWRRNVLTSLAWVLLWGGGLTISNRWGNNLFSYLATIWIVVTLASVIGFIRAYRRGWRRGGTSAHR